jgi:hypothetical protein
LCRRWRETPSAFFVDPLGFDAGDSNLYRYVNNRSTFVTDPSGYQQATSGRIAVTVLTGKKNALPAATKGIPRLEFVIMTFIPEEKVKIPTASAGAGISAIGVGTFALGVVLLPVGGVNLMAVGAAGAGIGAWDAIDVYEGDNRGFTNGDPTKQKRFRTKISGTVDVKNVLSKSKAFVNEDVNDSVRFSSWTGAEVERRKATIGNGPDDQIRDKFDGFWRKIGGVRGIAVSVLGEHQIAVGRNPRVITPPITFGIVVEFANIGQNWFARTWGSRTGFPNYEIFAREEGKNWASIFQYDHQAAGTNPFALLSHKFFQSKWKKL